MARGAVLGARGNSGVILSQVLRGLAESMPGDPDGAALAKALARAAELAWTAVAEPVEGTMLSVVRAAGRGRRPAPVTRSPRSPGPPPAAPPARSTAPPSSCRCWPGPAWSTPAAAACACCWSRWPPSSPATRCRCRRPAPAGRRGRWPARPGSDAYGYEVQYLLDAADTSALRAELVELGDSLVVVGTGEGTWTVHVHVNDIGAAIEAGVRAGGRTGSR
jgi:hypothetical protein